MAFLEVDNVKLSGTFSCVPEQIIHNIDLNLFNNKEDAEKFISVTGVEKKRHVSSSTCTSDLCYKAAEHLIEGLNWDKNEIDILIFVSQTPDFVAPNTSIILQDRLGLSKSCICFDVPLGCSGFVYGISILSQFLQNGSLKKGLLLVGDTLSRQCSLLDKSTYPLFGDAGTATALEFSPGQRMKYYLWSDGSGCNSIIVPDGGYRNPLSENSFEMQIDEDGNSRSRINTYMNGSEVFSFGISEVPKAMRDFGSYFNLNLELVDYVIFHQANKFMNEMIRKKLHLSSDQVPYSLTQFGNTSSATIPLTLSTLESNVLNKSLVMCGFGVGLSIGILHANIDHNFVNGLIQY